MPGIFAISDLHLPTQTQISKYGAPSDYFQQVSNYLEQINPDILLIAGDLVWGSDISEIQAELDLLRELPGKLKFFIEGNHDIWVDRLSTSYRRKGFYCFDKFDQGRDLRGAWVCV
jgi:predicted phosphohydrolase